MKKLFLSAIIFLAPVFGCSTFQPGTDLQTPPFTGSTRVNTDTQYCREPSGIVYSTRRGTLFIADDEGDICELLLDGTLINKTHVDRADIEGITIDPATGLLYAMEEHSMIIMEFHPDSLEPLRQFPLDATSDADLPARKNSNRGFEAITFVPDSGHPAGGTFFIASQGWRTRHAKGIAAVYEIAAPLQDTANANQTAHMVRHFEPGITDLSGLHYDARMQQLLLISDQHDTLMLLGTDGNTRASYKLPGKNQEGITMDSKGQLYIAEDSGDIIKYRFDATTTPWKH